VYSFFTPGNDFVGMLLEDTMVATTAEGLTGALIAIVPLKFLDGHDLWAVSKRLWIGAFALVATAFALLVLPTAIEGTDVADYGTWLLVFAAFGLVSVLIWFIFARADAKAAQAEGEKVDA
jgi:Na+-transporting NADH:ubiquinone oxidoreductase subunit NqrD